MQKKGFFQLKTLVLVALLAALVLVLSFISIPIGEISRIHFGNIMCLLSGLLFGPLVGGFAAGLGSMLYDFTNPLYVSEFWITFLTKFAMGFAAGLLNRYVLKALAQKLRLVVSAAGGAALYVVLYLAKSVIVQRFVMASPWPAVWPVVATKAVASSINAVLAVVGSVLLALALGPVLRSAGLFKDQAGGV